jgi:hypothetical protein
MKFVLLVQGDFKSTQISGQTPFVRILGETKIRSAPTIFVTKVQ